MSNGSDGSLGVTEATVDNSVALAPGGLGDFTYIPRRGLFNLNETLGSGRYVFEDGSFNNDDLIFQKTIVLTIGSQNLIGQVYKTIGADFFIYFGSEKFATTQDGLDLDLFPMLFSTDQQKFFPWPTSGGLALRFPIPPVTVKTTNVGKSPGSDTLGNDGVNVGECSFFERHGLAWKYSMCHNDVNNVVAGGTGLASLVPDPEIRAAIAACLLIIKSVDELGGNNGVDISGVLPTSYVLVTPRGSVDIFQIAQIIGDTAKKIGDQTTTGIKDAVKGITAGINQAGTAAGNVEAQATNLAHRLGL